MFRIRADLGRGSVTEIGLWRANAAVSRPSARAATRRVIGERICDPDRRAKGSDVFETGLWEGLSCSKSQ